MVVLAQRPRQLDPYAPDGGWAPLVDRLARTNDG